MTAATRVAAGAAALITALLVQATVVGPASYPWPVSLPAVLVAAVALVDGPGTGMSLGFAAGLIADLGSHHPAGVLALCWLAVGVVCGMLGDLRSVRRDALLAGVVCSASGAVTIVLLEIARGSVDLGAAMRYLAPTALADAALALVLVPLVRAALHTESLRSARSSAPLIGAGRE